MDRKRARRRCQSEHALILSAIILPDPSFKEELSDRDGVASFNRCLGFGRQRMSDDDGEEVEAMEALDLIQASSVPSVSMIGASSAILRANWMPHEVGSCCCKPPTTRGE